MNPLAKRQKVSDETPEPVSHRNVSTLATAMKNSTLLQLNILELPNEVLLKIFSFIHGFKHHHKLSLTCKRFYELSCEFIECRLIIASEFISNQISTPYLDDVDMLDSILNSERKITVLILPFRRFWKGYEKTWTFKKDFDSKLKRILERHGSRIEEFYMFGHHLSTEEVLMLNLMPNLKIIDLRRLDNDEDWDVPKELRLNLPKLYEISINESTLPVYGLGNHLPDDVLTYAIFCHSTYVVPLPFIAKQRNLKKLVLAKYTDLDTSQLKLEYLSIKSEFDFNGQDKLRFLDLRGRRDADDMNAIATKLISLEHLSMMYPVEDFEPLRDIKSLKKLEVSMVAMHSLSTLRSNYITKLTIATQNDFAINEISIGQLANGCPNLVEFTLRSEHSLILHKQVNCILSLLPRLETFKCHIDMENYKYVEGVEHENLKCLDLIEDKESKELVKLVANCKNLESLKIKCLTNANFLKDVLISRPTLKSFCADFMSDKTDFLEILQGFGQNLSYFHSCIKPPNEILTRYLADQTLSQRLLHFKTNHHGFWLKKNEAFKYHYCAFF
jgi:hypothetical protein